MPRMVHAQCDPTLTARVVRRWPLYYCAGADAPLDRPGHVRAGSGLTRLGGRLALIQDDANFVALFDPDGRGVESILLPAGLDGRRQFDDRWGNKKSKLDLEACTTVLEGDSQVLVAFGSGSSPAREYILVIERATSASPCIKLHHAPAFYAALRSHVDFAGSELNVEGAAYLGGDTLRLFQRGNGSIRGDQLPVNATCDVSWQTLRHHLDDAAAAPPTPENIVQYDLGLMEGVRLSFTDGAVRCGCVFFTATAEASPDAVQDGPVMGSILGEINEGGGARWAVLQDQDGGRLRSKVEGLSLDEHDRRRAWVSIDPDDPCAASEICEIELGGDWSS